ncbi:ATP-binding protein [Robertmurraya andreesenii]|uniref:histidine kinase n=1 Tax=Anoxybacillus andreesenii TaxID=1325932 RepID=A0ABT9V0U9_9BACL|nr:ATP-binding protein [Robertmurraya andreesenii]MDQ0154515.1 signal transduction histidine kinase [Robertmurraya andreesenii]
MTTNQFEQLNRMRRRLNLYKQKLKESREEYAKLQKEYDQLALQSSYLESVGKLAAGIAHEIRNPLTTIKGFIQLVRPYLIDIQKEEYADISLDEIERANKILFQFLNAAKPQKKETRIVSVNKLIEEMALLYEGEASLQGISIKTVPSSDNPSILIDEYQLKAVLVNMMKNAFEAIRASERIQGRICMRTEIRGAHSVISIHDNGCGIPQETIASLFTPFFTTKTTGTGLGLIICKNIIHDFGGDIQIRSRLGEGTTFYIELPLANEYIMHA